jgi:Flp pilus assembly pilin Flp
MITTAKKNYKEFLVCEKGSTAIEYSLIAGAMFLAITPAFYMVRDSINVKFEAIVGYFATT